MEDLLWKDKVNGKDGDDILAEDINSIANYANELNKGKVDKVDSKDLSTNDYTDEDKEKLNNIEDGANKTVVDSELSETSTNPVQNKVTLEALNGKADSIINTALGETIQLTDSAGEKLKGLNVYGKTTQADTPSVENPVALESIGDDGSVDLIVCSKNVLKFPYADTTVTKNGITWTVNSDGSITANGTATANSNFTLANDKNIAFGTYTFSVNYSDTSNVGLNTIFAYIYVGNTYLSLTSKRTFTIDATPSQFVINLRVISGVTVNNLVFKPQLEFGTANTDYEMFKGIQSFVLSTPNGLCGIPVSSGGNYTENGQQWICDEIDLARGVHIHRLEKIEAYNGEEITTPYMSTTGELSTGATVIYVLPGPIETPLTEEEINAYKELKTYKPSTNIVSDENTYMEVCYVADTKTYIDNKIDNKFAELQAMILEG